MDDEPSKYNQDSNVIPKRRRIRKPRNRVKTPVLGGEEGEVEGNDPSTVGELDTNSVPKKRKRNRKPRKRKTTVVGNTDGEQAEEEDEEGEEDEPQKVDLEVSIPQKVKAKDILAWNTSQCLVELLDLKEWIGSHCEARRRELEEELRFLNVNDACLSANRTTAEVQRAKEARDEILAKQGDWTEVSREGLRFCKASILRMQDLQSHDNISPTSVRVFQDLVKREKARITESLPFLRFRSKLLDTIQSSQVSVIIGETGSGKSTQMAQYILDELDPKKKIVVTQPRRVAASSLSQRLGKGYFYGDLVTSQSSPAALESASIHFMTDRKSVV